ncbi:hypothetical protein KKG61_03850 [bacterium]|nr:hypothetical protein [bacterium]
MNEYQRVSFQILPRLLSLLDRNRFSPTYGCFDRNFWHYKASDFPSAIWQQGVLSVSLIYRHNEDGNIYFENPNLLEWIRAGCKFWISLQNKDGSFNEWYPEEHSYVATAFTAYGVSESLLLLDEKPEDVISALIKAGKWLVKNNDELVANHTAGSIAALYNIYLLTNERSFRDATEEKLERLIRCQNSEGWFPEYGGADIGYLSLSIDYLAKYYKKTKDVRAKETIGKCLDFLVYFIHPDGSSGGEYGSRNTTWLMPHGLSILANDFEEAGYILNLTEKRLIDDLLRYDDRYLVFFFLPNYIQAGLEFKKAKANPEEYNHFTKHFLSAGLFSKKTREYHIICSLKKNGVLRLFSGERLVLSDSGYFGRLGKRVITSAWLNHKTEVNLMDEKSLIIRVEDSHFAYSNYIPNLQLPFRLFTLVAGRVPAIAKLFATWLKKTMIQKKREAPLTLFRRILVYENKITIEDEIIKKTKKRVDFIALTTSVSALYSPTSRYFYSQEIALEQGIDLSERLNKEGKVIYIREKRFNGT